MKHQYLQELVKAEVKVNLVMYENNETWINDKNVWIILLAENLTIWYFTKTCMEEIEYCILRFGL